MTPIVDEDELLPEVEPSRDFADEVTARVARLDSLRAALAAEERRSAAMLVPTMVLIGGVLGAVVAGTLVPPLLALRGTWDTAAAWVSGATTSAWAPGALTAVTAGAALWLACEVVGRRTATGRRKAVEPSGVVVKDGYVPRPKR